MARYTRNEASTVPQINTELEKIEAAIEDSLSRKGDAPNSMSGPLDMNNQRILNIPEPVDSTDPLRKIDGEQYVTAAAASAAEALESEQNAAASATSAAASASSASSDASVAAGLIEDLNAIYLGAFTTGPETDNEGNPLQQGALYYNTITKNLMVFNGTSWVISVSQELADAAAASAAQAEDSAAAALASEQAADTSEQLAEQHKDSALASASSASSSASSASASQSAAATSATNAATSASQASSSASAASASASAAAVSETNASNSESAAATSESNAASSASAALSSEAEAATSEINAAASETNAAASATAASGSATAASNSAAAALASEAEAATSEANAASSSTLASSFANAAQTSATSASISADAASDSATAAGVSETNAAASETASATSATDSANSAIAASASESNAATSATSAASSATAAAGSATSASNSAATALLYLNDTEAARDEVLQYSTAVSKGLVFVGVYDASTGVYPSLPVDVIGNPFWIIETSGTISGTVYQAGDSLIRDVENEEWIKLDTVDQVSSVAGKVGAVVLDRSDVGLSNVDNTSDLNKPISTATQSALDGKAAVSHIHSIANVTGLQSALDGKAPLTGGGTSGTWPISVTGNAATVSNGVYTNNTQTISGIKTFTDGPYLNGPLVWRVSASDSALQRADARDDAANFSRLHWYGASDAGATSNFRHAWYDGANYIPVTADSGTVTFGGQITATQFNGALSGNAATATKLATGRSISLTGDVTGSTTFDGSGNVSITATVADDSHNHVISNVDGLQAALDGKAATSHTHSIANVTGLQSALDGKLSTSGKAADSNLLDGYNYTHFNGVVARYITSGSSSSGRLKLKLPFSTASNLMLKFTISQYTGYEQHTYEVSAYLYNSTNQWYLPKAVYSGTGSPDIFVGREADGKAYVSIANSAYTGTIVHSLTMGYVGTAADAYNQGWVITDDASIPNYVGVDVRNNLNSGNYTTYVPTKTGVGASGTWGISITGNSATTSQRSFSGTLTGEGDIRSPIFYDSNNTGYYVDPASTSVLNVVDLEGTIRHKGDTNTYMEFHASDQWRVVTGGAERLEVNNSQVLASVALRCTTDITAYYSDERLKDFHGNIPNALEKVNKLGGYYFTENDKAKELGYNNNSMQIGVNAQEVQAVLPEAVAPAPINFTGAIQDGTEYLTVKYEKLVPLLIEAIKEQQTQIEALTSEINTLKEMIK